MKKFLGLEELDDSDEWSKDQIATAQYALGNMLGSMTYMYGDRQVFKDDLVFSQAKTSMFVIVPDRPDHGQGFMWDEGFHQHLVSVWNMNLTQEIISSWFNQTEDDGWIARQQLLGDEIRWSAEPTSWPQINGTANPPSQHLLLDTLIERMNLTGGIQGELNLEQKSFVAFLDDIYPKFRRNVDWFIRTQQSKLGENLFRWAGRTPGFTLPSGMDDYPRAPILTEQEAHLDLQVWMVVSSRTIAKVAGLLGKTTDSAFYEAQAKNITDMIEEHFWDESRNIYDEFYFDEANQKQFDGHLGYLNFWPVFLNAVDSNSTRFETMMRKLIDKDNGIWTPFGLRSLSSHDPYFKQGVNYWTSPIWMNINFLINKAMFNFVNKPEEFPMDETLRADIKTAYKEIRQNLIDMFVDNYVRTGYIWEVYDGDSGQGIDNHPFTGWSALIVNLMGEIY